MGREIRRVPPGWQHPKQECRHSPWRGGCDEAKADGGRCYVPLVDGDYDTVAARWIADLLLWSKGEHPDQEKSEAAAECRYFWEWAGGPPNKDSYRPKFEAEPTAYQVYETVSEGTPTSPVFETREALHAWLVGDRGLSHAAADSFIESAWAPSMVMGPGGTFCNEQAHEQVARDKAERQ